MTFTRGDLICECGDPLCMMPCEPGHMQAINQMELERRRVTGKADINIDSARALFEKIETEAQWISSWGSQHSYMQTARAVEMILAHVRCIRVATERFWQERGEADEALAACRSECDGKIAKLRREPH